jgi:hypothetical protein
MKKLAVGEVASPWLFAMKVTGAICATSGNGGVRLLARESARAIKEFAEVSAPQADLL